MKPTFSKPIFFNGDTERVFYFLRIHDESTNEISYLITTREEGYLTTMIYKNRRWRFPDLMETPMLCHPLEDVFEQIILENRSE